MNKKVFLRWFNLSAKFFQADFSICLSVLNKKGRFTTFVIFILGLNLKFSLQHPKCKQEHGLVYITKNCVLFISLII